MTRAAIDEVWYPVCELGINCTVSKIADKIYTHDGLIWNGKLWIFSGTGSTAAHVAVVLSYNLTTGVLTEEYNTALVSANASLIWRTGVIFNNELYVGLNGLTTVNEGSVWKYNSTGSMTKVLDTKNFNPPAAGVGQLGVLALCVHNNKIWAGAGNAGTGEATLYSSSDGTTWTLEHTFTGYDFIRGMASWNGKLWIGTRANASLWSYDGSAYTQISNWPAEAIYQAKELIPYNGKLYIGCVNTGTYDAKVYSYDGSTFKTEINMPADHEIYHGEVVNGQLYFAVRTSDTNATGGAVICTDGTNWRTVFRDTGVHFNHIMWVTGNGNDLYVSGSNLAQKDVLLYKAINQRTAV